jgi:hypothetical protein
MATVTLPVQAKGRALNVLILMDGYEEARFSPILDVNGTTDREPPPLIMVEAEEESSGGLMSQVGAAAFSLLALALVISVFGVASLIRRSRSGRKDDTGDPGSG